MSLCNYKYLYGMWIQLWHFKSNPSSVLWFIPIEAHKGEECCPDHMVGNGKETQARSSPSKFHSLLYLEMLGISEQILAKKVEEPKGKWWSKF